MITFGHVTQFGALGALTSSADIRALQDFLAKQNQLAAAQVTGQMNDATMATVYRLLVENLGVIAKLDVLPSEVRTPISTVRSVITLADKAIKGITFDKINLKDVITNFSKAIGLVRAAGFLNASLANAANKVEAKRDEVYNAVGKQAKWIEKGLRAALAVTALVTPGTSTGTSAGTPGKMTFDPRLVLQTLVKAGGTAATTPATATAALPFVGCVFRYNKTRKKYVIYCRPSGGLGVADMDDNCLYGACALGGTLGQVAVTPPPPEGMVETSAVDSRAEAGGATDGGEENVPLYKRPWFWASVAGAAAVGAGGVVLWRRKRAPTAGQFAEAYGRRSYGGLGRRAWNARRGRAYYDWY
jgi:hypothetical protein